VLKVTFVAYDKPDNVGGPPAWLQRLLPALRGNGIEARCLFLLHWGETGPSVEFLRAQGFDCPAILAPATTEERVRWILTRLRENPPDVFVPNLVVAAYLAARWVRQAGIPTVGILHSDDAFYRGLQDQFVFGRKLDQLSAVVCVSQELERQVQARKPAVTRVARIGYGVPVPETTVRHQPAGLRLAYVGRLAEEQKRISEVTRALCRITREIVGTEAVIYGDGPERESVERILASEGAGLPVRLAGLIDSNRIQEHLLACDVIVLLSDYEGLPIALMEAMACGCVPVCLRMRSGIPELVDDGVTGLLVDDRGDDFVAAIRRLRDDHALWEKLSQAARARIKERQSIAASAGEWIELLGEIDCQSPSPHLIKLPRYLRLPAVHPALASADVRRVGPPLSVRFYRRTRMLAGHFKRRLLGQPLS
jgi:glycosyltransferase involved in cell wall biosynthesis